MTVQEQSEFDAKFSALQTVSRMAYAYIDNLQPGDRPALQIEAAKHFDVGSEGYGLFIGAALHHMSQIADLDAEGRIISIAQVKS